MRRIVIWVMGTLSGVALLFGYHTSTDSGATTAAGDGPAGTGSASGTSSSGTSSSGTSSSGSTASGTSSGSSASGTSSGSSASGTASSGTPSSGGASSVTYTGTAVSTRWGDVQVQITVADGKVTDVQAIEYPHDNQRDAQINAYALPVLRQEALTAQSGTIDAVSGATVTSDGYIASLQSAIDQAHL